LAPFRIFWKVCIVGFPTAYFYLFFMGLRVYTKDIKGSLRKAQEKKTEAN
jgi:hypothetical protein